MFLEVKGLTSAHQSAFRALARHAGEAPGGAVRHRIVDVGLCSGVAGGDRQPAFLQLCQERRVVSTPEKAAATGNAAAAVCRGTDAQDCPTAKVAVTIGTAPDDLGPPGRARRAGSRTCCGSARCSRRSPARSRRRPSASAAPCSTARRCGGTGGWTRSSSS